MLSNLLDWSRRRHTRFGEVSWGGAFGTEIVLVLGPEGIGEVLSNSDKAFSNKEGWEYLIGPFFERGVMLMDFDEHRLHRRIMQQAFKSERLVAYLEDMNPVISRGLGGWREQDGFALYPAVKQLTLDLATDVFVGDHLGAEATRVNEAFVATVHGRRPWWTVASRPSRPTVPRGVPPRTDYDEARGRGSRPVQRVVPRRERRRRPLLR
jgi:cytochrome P450